MPSSFFSVSPAGLAQLGESLSRTAAMIADGAEFPPAHGAEAYAEVAGAVSDFAADWENAVGRLHDQTDDLGAKATAIGRMLAEQDAALAQGFGGAG
jgi:hypothetical protein